MPRVGQKRFAYTKKGKAAAKKYAKKKNSSQTWCPISEIIQGTIKTDGCNTTLFDATGLAIEDVATGRYIYEKLIKSEQHS